MYRFSHEYLKVIELHKKKLKKILFIYVFKNTQEIAPPKILFKKKFGAILKQCFDICYLKLCFVFDMCEF